MPKKKILFITGEFVPYTQSVGGVIRVISFLKSLKNNDIKIISLKKKNYGYFGFKKYVKNIHRIYIKAENIEKKNFLFYILRITKILFSNVLYLIGLDNSYFYLNKYDSEIKKITKTFKPDFVIISSPPFSLFRLVKTIKKRVKNTKIILDYRDGWTNRINTFHLTPLKMFMLKKEYEILKFSDHILCATNKIYKDLLIVGKNKKTLLTNGYFSKYKTKIKSIKSKKIKIGYFGLISDSSNSFRDLKVIYNSVKNNHKLHFSFYGNSKISNNLVKNYKNFMFKRNIPYFDAISKMSNFNYLLILHTEKSTSKEVVTGKFYEYLSSGIPIIVVSNGETEVGKLIKRYNLGLVIDYNKKSLTNFFDNLIYENRNFTSNKNIQTFSRDYQNKKLIKIINS